MASWQDLLSVYGLSDRRSPAMRLTMRIVTGNTMDFYLEADAGTIETVAVDVTPNTVSDITLDRKKGGRSAGTTVKKKDKL